MKRSFEVSTLIWPAIVQSQHSEKPSILKVIDDIVHKIMKNVETTAIEIKVFFTSLKCTKGWLVDLGLMSHQQLRSYVDRILVYSVN